MTTSTSAARHPSAPTVVDRATWNTRRDELAELERAEAAARDAALAVRRAMPAVEVDAAPLLDMFEGRRQLILYHFMYAPEWEAGCPNCTQFADGISPGVVRALAGSDTTIALVSRAEQDKLEAWRVQHGWELAWRTISADVAREYGSLTGDGDTPAINVFVRDGERVLHTFQARGREFELVVPAARWLDFTPYGELT